MGVQQVLVLAVLEHDKAVAEEENLLVSIGLGPAWEMNLRHISLTTASSINRRYSEHHGSGSNHGEQGRFEHE